MRLIKTFLFFFLSFLFIVAVQQYLLCPQFDFKSSGKFSGSHWYNPYEGLKQHWSKYNFHTHTNAWFGLTNGKGKEIDVEKRYRELGYSQAFVSNYHKPSSSSLIPVYEHGFNIQKTHQQVIGDKKVVWLDYVFPQTLANKQYILEKIGRTSSGLVCLNHPMLRDGYTEKEMGLLSQFQLMEVLHPYIESKKIWDAALSSGNPVFNIANDDVHNIFSQEQSGRFCTLLSDKSKNEDEIKEALKWGRNYGMKIGYNENESEKNRIQRIKYDLPELNKMELSKNQLFIALSKKAEKIVFVSDSGRISKVIVNAANGNYNLNTSDSYVRVEAYFSDGTELMFNPIYKYTDSPLEGRNSNSEKSLIKTLSISLMGYFLILSWIYFTIRLRFVPNKIKEKKIRLQPKLLESLFIKRI